MSLRHTCLIVILAVTLYSFTPLSAYAAAPSSTLAAAFTSEAEDTLQITLTPASSAENCTIMLFGAPQKWQVRWGKKVKLGTFSGQASASTFSASGLGRLKAKGKKTTAKVFLMGQIKCGGQKKRSKILKLSLTRAVDGTLGKSSRKWLKKALKPNLSDTTSPTATPTPAPPGAQWSLWQQNSYFRGANMVSWGDADQANNYELMTAQDFVNLKNTGANFVHLSVAGIYKRKSPYGVNTTRQNELDKMVQYAKAAGLYYVIAVRSGPGRSDVSEEDDRAQPCSTVWTNTTEQGKYGDMLAAMVSRYYDPLMAAINLTVEPNIGTCPSEVVESPEQLQTYMTNNSISLKTLYEAWIAKIRAVNATIPVIVQTGGWSAPHYFRVMPEISDSYVIYDVHFYEPYSFTHESPCDWPGNYDDPDDEWNTAYWDAAKLGSYFDNVSTFQTQVNKPVLLGEFGVNCKTSSAPVTYLQNMMDYALNKGWHLSIWGWHNNSMHGLDKASQAVQDFMKSVFNGSYTPGS